MFYQRLKEEREAHGLTQRELAERMGMLQPQYNRYERGLRDIPTKLLIELAIYYNTSVDYLLGMTDFREAPSDQKYPQQ